MTVTWPPPRSTAAERTDCLATTREMLPVYPSQLRNGTLTQFPKSLIAPHHRLDAAVGNRSQTLARNRQWLLPFFLPFPQGICFCSCFSFCHSRRESASVFAVACAYPPKPVILSEASWLHRDAQSKDPQPRLLLPPARPFQARTSRGSSCCSQLPIPQPQHPIAPPRKL